MKLASKYFYKSNEKEIYKYIKSDSEYINIVNHKYFYSIFYLKVHLYFDHFLVLLHFLRTH